MIEYMVSHSIQARLALERNRFLQWTYVTEWMIKRKTTLIPKNPSKRTAPNNYSRITCQPMMWKILTGQIREEIYYLLTSRRWFPEEKKGCHKRSRGTAELLYIDQDILNENKTRQKSFAKAWVDSIYDMVPQNWIIEFLKCRKYQMKSYTLSRKTWKLGEWNDSRKKLI